MQSIHDIHIGLIHLLDYILKAVNYIHGGTNAFQMSFLVN